MSKHKQITKQLEAHVDHVLPALTEAFISRQERGYKLTADDAHNIIDNAIVIAEVVAERTNS